MQRPGHELAILLRKINIMPVAGCRCKKMMERMNFWGVEGCKLHFDEIVMTLEEDAQLYHWGSYVSAAAMTVLRMEFEMMVSIDITYPFPGLVRLAIKRAESNSPTEVVQPVIGLPG